jgi:hypothetical protein
MAGIEGSVALVTGVTFAQFVGGIALGRAEVPDDVAGPVSYLASPDGRFIGLPHAVHASLRTCPAGRGFATMA